MKEPTPTSGEVVLSSRKRLKPPSSNNGQPSRRPTWEDELAGRAEVFFNARLLKTANVNHKSECYEDLEELEYPAALYSTMEQHLPPNFLHASREKKLALLDRILSKYRPNRERAKIWRCVGGGLLSIPVGTIIFALVALAFGAPTSLQYASQTIQWACLMSVLAVCYSLFFSFLIQLKVLPAAIVLGSSWPDWQRIFAFTRPRGGVERAICIPAHGAVIGAWIGAFPMPLDWERPWQEWPICCTYGAIGGYLLGLTISILLPCLHPKGVRSKID